MPSRFFIPSRLAFLTLVLLAPATLPTQAGTVSLAWDPVSQPQLAGYRIYHGPSTGNDTQTADVGLSTQTTLTVSYCTYRFITVKARTTNGTESVLFSNEISGSGRCSPRFQ